MAADSCSVRMGASCETHWNLHVPCWRALSLAQMERRRQNRDRHRTHGQRTHTNARATGTRGATEQAAHTRWLSLVLSPLRQGTGIGFHTSRWLAERGCHVILAGRSAERLAECEQKIRAASKAADGTVLPPEQVHLTSIVLDLSSLASVESFAEKYRALNLPLNILINNAVRKAQPRAHERKR